MPNVTEENVTSIDTVEKEKKAKKPTGKGARARRTEAFRIRKNQESDDAFLAGIYSRLKITDPTAVPALPLAKDVSDPMVVPVSFAKQPEFVDRVWDTAEAIGTRPFKDVNTPENKAIFKKGMLILAEAKICYAQRAHIDKPAEELSARNNYSEEELLDLNSMASVLPLPLAKYLECIGNVKHSTNIITPVLAEHRVRALSGAVSYAPRQLLPLLRILRAGVPIAGEVHQVADALLVGLPGIEWEEFELPPEVEGAEPRQAIRLNPRSIRFWLEGDPGSEKISWTDAEYRIFVKIIKSLQSKKGFNVTFDLSHGNGSLAQIIQFADPWVVDESIRWFSMYEVSDYDVKIGAALGFGYDAGTARSRSRFRGYYETSLICGEITPRRAMIDILSPQE